MRCPYPLERLGKHKERLSLPCGRCLPCRIRKRSAWVLRLHAEAWKSSTQSFWTLTLDDASLHMASEGLHRATVRTFFLNLQQSERRAGNTSAIRYFGCLEFGSNYGRPHWHFLIFNLAKHYREPPKYLKHLSHLPRPRLHIDHWPHGLVDIAEYNSATVHYVTNYVTDFESVKNPDLPPPRFYSSRLPAIGFYGLSSVAELLAQKLGTVPGLPTSISLAGRHYPLDTWARATLRKQFTAAGGIIRPPGTPKSRADHLFLEALEVDRLTPDWLKRKAELNYDAQAQAIERKKAKTQERNATRRALAAELEARGNHAARIATTNSDADDAAG